MKKETHPIYFFDTLTKGKKVFTPLHKNEVRLYSCGPTVYSRAHIGNMRSYVMSDTIRRVLEYNDYKVNQVINITDVGHLVSDGDEGEDKLEKAATESGESAQNIAEKYTKLFFEDIVELNIETDGTKFPKATDYIQSQIAMVQSLMETGHAYQISDGIYFDTSVFKDYGALGNIPIEELEEGARVDKNNEKRHPTDFALWKFSPKDSKRQQEWPSPWGVGFPGWHIECSAMSRALLGRSIDIHTGGIDHIATHHNNEIAQSESVNKKKFVNYWIHNAFITVEGRRMGKSVGNLISLDQIIDRGYSPLAYRYLLLTAHYSTPLNFTWDALEGAHTALIRIYSYFVENLKDAEGGALSQKYKKRFIQYINDNMDTPHAIALVWELIKDKEISKEDKKATLLDFDRVLGIGLDAKEIQLTTVLKNTAKKIEVNDIPSEVQNILTERKKAREDKDYKKADELRDTLDEMGYEINDTEHGAELLRKTEK